MRFDGQIRSQVYKLLLDGKYLWICQQLHQTWSAPLNHSNLRFPHTSTLCSLLVSPNPRISPYLPDLSSSYQPPGLLSSYTLTKNPNQPIKPLSLPLPLSLWLSLPFFHWLPFPPSLWLSLPPSLWPSLPPSLWLSLTPSLWLSLTPSLWLSLQFSHWLSFRFSHWLSLRPYEQTLSLSLFLFEKVDFWRNFKSHYRQLYILWWKILFDPIHLFQFSFWSHWWHRIVIPAFSMRELPDRWWSSFWSKMRHRPRHIYIYRELRKGWWNTIAMIIQFEYL